MSTAVANGTVVFNSQFDLMGRLTSRQQTGGLAYSRQVTWDYDALGHVISISRSSPINNTPLTTTQTYDTFGRLETILHAASSTLSSYSLKYNAAGDITRVDSSNDGSSIYSYDSSGQLTGADHSSLPDESYTYERHNGNRIGPNITNADGNLLQSDGSYNYQYDEEGNLIRHTALINGQPTGSKVGTPGIIVID